MSARGRPRVGSAVARLCSQRGCEWSLLCRTLCDEITGGDCDSISEKSVWRSSLQQKELSKNLDVVRDIMGGVANDIIKPLFATSSAVSRTTLREPSGGAVDAWRNTTVRGGDGYAISTLPNSCPGFHTGKSPCPLDLTYPRRWPPGRIGRQATCRLGVASPLHPLDHFAPLSINIIGERSCSIPQRMPWINLKKRRSLSGTTIQPNPGPVLVLAVSLGFVGSEAEALEDAKCPDYLEVPLNRPSASSGPFGDGGRRRPGEVVRGLGTE